MTQRSKFLELTECVADKLYRFMNDTMAGKFGEIWEIGKGTGEKAKIEYVCREYMKPVDNFIVRLGERSKLQAVCKPSTDEAVADVDLADELNVDGASLLPQPAVTRLQRCALLGSGSVAASVRAHARACMNA